ncbi:MAG: cytochrome c [Myxococcota bacterium]
MLTPTFVTRAALIALLAASASSCKKSASATVEATQEVADNAAAAVDRVESLPSDSPATAAGPAVDPKAAAIVAYRHNMMEGMGKHMKLSAMIVKGEVDRPDDMLMHAEALHKAAFATPTLFPKSTGPGKIKSDSLPAVWEQWDGFLAANKTYEEATAKLVEVAKAKDLAGFRAQFGAVGRSCGGCHETFRVDED